DARYVLAAGLDAMLGEVPFHDHNLAATAHGATAADRIDIDAQLARSGEHTGADRKAPAPSRWREDNEGVGGCHRGPRAGPDLRLSAAAQAALATAAGRALGTCLPRRRRLAITRDPACAMRIVAHHHIRAHARLHDLGVQWVRDGRGQARTD